MQTAVGALTSESSLAGRGVVRRFSIVVAAGAICGLLAVVLAIGNATLLAHSDLSKDLPSIVGIVLFGAAVLPVSTAYLSTIAGQVTTTQEISVIALEAVVAASAATFKGAHDSPGFLITLVIVVGLTTGLSGLSMFLLGAARLGRVIRFVPFPVFGGFLAITGWYLLVGGLETSLGFHLSSATLAAIVEPDSAFKLACDLAFVSLLIWASGRDRTGLVVPGVVLSAIVLFNSVVYVTGLSSSALQRMGWLLTLPQGGATWPPIKASALTQIDWTAVGAGLVFAPFVIIVTTAAAMMNVSGIEIEIKGDVDLDRELRSMGIGNMCAGLAGGISGFPGVSSTLLAIRLGAAEPAVGLVAGGVTLAALVFAPQVLGIVPAPLLGALLMWLGVSLLGDWVIKPLRTLRRREHAIIVVILAVSVVAGFPAGIVAGLLCALILFVFEYSRVEGIHFVTDGQGFQSRMLPEERRRELQKVGRALLVMKLSGFIFFGTSDNIIQRIARRVAEPLPDPVRFVVIDFCRVDGIDSSTIMSFDRLRRLALREGFQVILSGLSDDIASRLETGGADISKDPFRVEIDLDTAVAWTESRLLGPPSDPTEPDTDARALAVMLGDDGLANAMRPHLQRVSFPAGQTIIETGATSDTIFFIESGTGLVQSTGRDGEAVRVMSFSSGAILGEVAFYRQVRRTTSATAQSSVRAWQLTRTALREFEAEAPHSAASFHIWIARTLADRLQSANDLFQIMAE